MHAYVPMHYLRFSQPTCCRSHGAPPHVLARNACSCAEVQHTVQPEVLHLAMLPLHSMERCVYGISCLTGYIVMDLLGYLHVWQ